MRPRAAHLVLAAGLAVAAMAAVAGWRWNLAFAEETYAAAARASAADRDDAMALLAEACGEGSQRACDVLNDGGGPETILH